MGNMEAILNYRASVGLLCVAQHAVRLSISLVGVSSLSDILKFSLVIDARMINGSVGFGITAIPVILGRPHVFELHSVLAILHDCL